MELKDLKSAWNKVSSANERKQNVASEDLEKMLQKRTRDISEKIGRNIRIGIGIILGWVCLGFVMDFVLSPAILQNIDKPYLTDKIMFWAFILESLIYVLVFAAIIIFWVRYNRLEKADTDSTNLNEKLTKLINILSSYRKMFYIVLWFVLLYASVAFTSGFFMEYTHQVQESGLSYSTLDTQGWIIMVVAFLISLGLIVLIYYLLFTLFFKRLYGKYLKQLKATLKELNEPIND